MLPRSAQTLSFFPSFLLLAGCFLHKGQQRCASMGIGYLLSQSLGRLKTHPASLGWIVSFDATNQAHEPPESKAYAKEGDGIFQPYHDFFPLEFLALVLQPGQNLFL